MEEKFVCPCGLTCRDCMFFQQEVFDAAAVLKDLIKKHDLDTFLTLCSKKQSIQAMGAHLGLDEERSTGEFAAQFEIFESMPEFMRILDAVIQLRCRQTCREAGGCSEGGKTRVCIALQCVQSKGLDGCWACGSYKSCDKLSFLKNSYGHVIDENLQLIHEKGPAAVQSRGDEYYAWQRKKKSKTT